jgi:D-glycero-D-manno-heptose 1,7-bisphosphate phosphatase
MWAQLADADAFVNAILACPHHPEGSGLLRVSSHPDRKPNPGMLLRALDILPIDAAASWMVGDRVIDVQAAKAAGLAGAVHMRSSHKDSEAARGKAAALADAGFRVRACDDADKLTEVLNPLWAQD